MGNQMIPSTLYTNSRGGSWSSLVPDEAGFESDALAAATTQLHDERPDEARRPGESVLSTQRCDDGAREEAVQSATNLITVYDEVLACMGDGQGSLDLVEAIRERLEQAQADVQSLITTVEGEEALLQLFNANETLQQALNKPRRPLGDRPSTSPSVAAPTAAAEDGQLQLVDELSSLLGVPAAAPISTPMKAD